MSRQVTVSTVQPPAPVEGAGPDEIQSRALELLEDAATHGADIVCLPEWLNAMGCGPDAAPARAGAPARDCLERAAATARRCRCYAVVPLLCETEEGRVNRAHLINRDGELVGHYDKVHLTQAEREDWRLAAGDGWPVFELDFGRVGIMICYDGCFVESARSLALQGAEVVLWPSLQRGYTESELLLQVRAHAYFNGVVAVRSSYGTERGRPWRPGTMVGLSCVCGPDGHVVASLGRWAGWTSATLDLDAPPRGERSFGGETGVLREMRAADRRPETYGAITRTR